MIWSAPVCKEHSVSKASYRNNIRTYIYQAGDLDIIKNSIGQQYVWTRTEGKLMVSSVQSLSALYLSHWQVSSKKLDSWIFFFLLVQPQS